MNASLPWDDCIVSHDASRRAPATFHPASSLLPWVYLGPSLPRERARTLLDARWLPPCRLGDVRTAVRRGARVIALIDGVFEPARAVGHREILDALSQGVQVFGGASMGALRAAELHPFGMVGVGRVFEAYAGGALEDDDEVAVVHGPAEAGYACLSEPMVNIRDAAVHAVRARAIDAGLARRLLALAKALHYPERHWAGLCARLRQEGVAAEALQRLRRFVSGRGPGLKARDAMAVLRAVALSGRACRTPTQPAFDRRPTRENEPAAH